MRNRLFFRIYSIALAILGCLVATEKASASTIAFTAGGSWSPTNTSNVLSCGTSGAKLTYDAPTPFLEPDGTFSYATTFGDFALTAGTSKQTFAPGDISDITIVINQTDPAAGTFDLVGHFIGGDATLSKAGGLANSGAGQVALVYFDSSTWVIDGIDYKITSLLQNLTGAEMKYNGLPGVTLVNAGGVATIQGALSGTATPVPLPSVAWSAIGMFGLVAVGKRLRGATRII